MRARLRFTKTGKLRFLSHRDLARLWERSLRRAGVQVAYSEGFSPRPKLHFGLALSTGHESLGEYLDIDLVDGTGVEPADLPDLVRATLPAGIEPLVAVPVAPGTDSLQQSVTSCSWEIELIGPDRDTAVAAVEAALRRDLLPIVVERKGSPVELDARPCIVTLQVADEVRGDHPVLLAELATQPRSLRPAELVRALDAGWREGRVLRTHQWTLVDGARREPIPLPEGGARGALTTPHAGARA